jgi:hypothetical protein
LKEYSGEEIVNINSLTFFTNVSPASNTFMNWLIHFANGDK